MDSVRNATFRIKCSAALYLLALHSDASRLEDTMRLFYPEMAILTSRSKSLDRHMAAFSIIKWHNSLREGKSLSRYNAAFCILKWQYSTKLDKSKKINIIVE